MVLLLALLPMVACSSPSGDATWAGSQLASTEPLYEGAAVVVQGDGKRPLICLYELQECFGIPLTSWDWGAVEGEVRSAGSTRGEFKLLGTYDGESFTVIEAGDALPPAPFRDPGDTPCPEPEGGCVVKDRYTLQELARIQEEVNRLLEDVPHLIGTNINVTRNRVEVDAGVLTEELLDTIRSRYGEDTVVINALLEPVEA